jgi:hypothetical protein
MPKTFIWAIIGLLLSLHSKVELLKDDPSAYSYWFYLITSVICMVLAYRTLRRGDL